MESSEHNLEVLSEDEGIIASENLTTEQIIETCEKYFKQEKFKKCISYSKLILCSKNFRTIAHQMYYFIGICYEFLKETKKANRAFKKSLNLFCKLSISERDFRIENLLEKHNKTKDEYLGLIKFLKMKINNKKGKCIKSIMNLAAIYVELEGYNEAINVNLKINYLFRNTKE